ncbi:MAG: hypothetical protein DWQ31_10075 [Planctomycetota bacterium]|nr:MAG: hypothetical protein DWQ31_10075 [Planctomycetota bacterium]REJ96869.1 MAG: hypothetical protein DWQ35_03665 [Planctomycetota bacterium]
MFRLARLLAIAAVWTLLPAAIVQAETALDQQISHYRELLRRGTNLQPLGARELAASRRSLLVATGRLESYLSRAGADAATAWKNDLQWPAMRETLEREQPDLAVLKSARMRYFRNVPGLEEPAFVTLRSSLDDFLIRTRYAEAALAQQNSQRLLEEFALRLARYERHPTRDDALAIGQTLAFLELSGSASDELLDTLRARFDHPNGFMRVSNRLIGSMLRRVIDDVRPFNRSSGRITTRGTARTTGDVYLQPVPSTADAAFDIRLIGTIRSPDMVSRQRNVVVRSTCVTQVDARKRVRVTNGGITFESASANCRSELEVVDVDAPRRFVERLASRRANRQISQYESETEGIARREISGQLDTEVDVPIKEANNVFNNHFRVPSIRFGAWPKQMDFYSRFDHVGANVHIAGTGRIGAPQPRLPDADEFDLGLLFHESFLDNYCAAMFAGRTIVDRQWANLVSIMTGREPRSLWVHDRTPSWSITFHELRPLEVDFDDDRFTISIRTQAATRGEELLDRPVLLAATYRVELGRDGAVLVREGDLTAQFDDGLDSASAEAAAASEGTSLEQEMLAMLAYKFNGVLQPEMHFDGLVPPAGGSLGRLREIEMQAFRAREGWLTLGFRLRGD